MGRGALSDTTFDGTAAFGAPPSGPWIATNDFYLYPAAACASAGLNASKGYGPGNFYAAIPAAAVHLLSVPLSGVGGVAVATAQINAPFDVPFADGD